MPPEINIHTGTLYKTTKLLKMLKEYIIRDIFKKKYWFTFSFVSKKIKANLKITKKSIFFLKFCIKN